MPARGSRKDDDATRSLPTMERSQSHRTRPSLRTGGREDGPGANQTALLRSTTCCLRCPGVGEAMGTCPGSRKGSGSSWPRLPNTPPCKVQPSTALGY